MPQQAPVIIIPLHYNYYNYYSCFGHTHTGGQTSEQPGKKAGEEQIPCPDG